MGELLTGEIEKNYPGALIESGAKIESRAWIGRGAVVESGALIESRALIKSGAVVESGAWIGSVISKFIGNISPAKDGMNIRIGCEIHPVEEWTKRGAAIARKAGESEWWDETGKAMLAYLVNEAKVYMAKYK